MGGARPTHTIFEIAWPETFLSLLSRSAKSWAGARDPLGFTGDIYAEREFRLRNVSGQTISKEGESAAPLPPQPRPRHVLPQTVTRQDGELQIARCATSSCAGLLKELGATISDDSVCDGMNTRAVQRF